MKQTKNPAANRGTSRTANRRATKNPAALRDPLFSALTPFDRIDAENELGIIASVCGDAVTVGEVRRRLTAIIEAERERAEVARAREAARGGAVTKNVKIVVNV